jgi:2-polyprenyl-6-methoxyphenol hydroxylase-like FAD-dependent oxidoreductase
VYWYATRNTPADSETAEGGRKKELLERFGDWHTPIPRLVETTEAGAILRNDVYDRKPAPQWGEGRVTLLGDAAHPTTPNLGQGACQAIEDAVVLGKHLSMGTDPIAALRGYEARRMPRTRRVVEQSWRIGVLGQWSHPLACWMRDTLMRMTPTGVILKQTDWIVDYNC